MSFDYAALRTNADALIDNFGLDVVLRRSVNSGTAWEPTRQDTEYSTKAVLERYSQREVDGQNILRTDRKAIVAAGPLGLIVPTTADKLVIGGAAYSIMQVDPVAPAGVSVIYEMQLRA